MTAPVAPSAVGTGGRPRLRVATTNPGKRDELFRILRTALGPAAAVLDMRDLGDLPGFVPAAEDAPTYRENVVRKALAARLADPGCAVLADDSGIEVDALGGGPGVRSARWATDPRGAGLSGAGLNAALLARLGGLPPERRAARMVAWVALLLPDGCRVAAGSVAGRVAQAARGSGGFGYDAVFVLPDGRRLSEVQPAEKDMVSHRGQAVGGVVADLRRWLGLPAAAAVTGAQP